MAVAFKQTKGKAESKKVDAYAFKDGEQRVRLHGGVLPRYMYWIKGSNNKDIPVECLAFNREDEKFDGAEIDHVTAFNKDLKCSWSYSINCIDPTDGVSKVFNLKKKLFAEIMDAAETLGDPTDPDTGWDIVFKKTKTGPLAFNVEYKLQVLKCKNRPLTDEERAAIAKDKTIDEKYPRPTPTEVKALLDRIAAGADEEASSGEGDGVPEEAKDL